MENKIRQTNLSHRKKNAAVLLILVALVFAVLIFSIWFCFEKIKEGSDKIISTKMGIATSEIEVNKINDFKSKYKDYLPNFQKIDQAVVNPQNPLNFIEFLENSADKNGVDLTISPMSFSKDAKAKTLSVSLAVNGKFIDVISFLREMENGPYLISIQNLTLEGVGSKEPDDNAATEIIKAVVMIDVLAK